MSTAKAVLIFICGALLCPLSHAAPPNIIFVLVDDLGWGDLSLLGQRNWETPEIDRMASEGMTFTQAYAGSTVCAPSRAALLIGNHTGKLHMRGNGRIELRPDPQDITVATRLRDAGYETAMIGKSGVACRSNDPDLPNAKGFDHFFGILDHAEAHRQYPKRLVRNGEWIELPENKGKTGETFVNELFLQEAIGWVKDRGDQPFFLHLSLTPPHADLVAPDRFVEPFRGRFEETAHRKGGYLHTDEPRAAYAGMVAFLDDAVGQLLSSLRDQGLAENTVVFFASDNGPHAEGGANPDFFDSNGPFRGGKRDLYEGGIRTPLIVWWPGTIEPDTRSDHLTAFWDFPATAVDLAGVEPIERTDGISIMPTLNGALDQQQKHRFLYWEFYEQGGKQAVRYGQWKGIRLNVHADRAGPIELYDLESDLGETIDLAGENPQLVRRIARFMDYANNPSPLFSFGTPERSISDDAEERRISNSMDRLLLDRSEFRIISVSSESAFNGRSADRALDDDLKTHWHSEWRDARPPHPHSLTIDLGRTHEVAGLRIMARQDAPDHGVIKRLDIMVAQDLESAEASAHEARLRFTKNEQQILLSEPARGRYLTLSSRSAHADSPFATIANLEVLGTAAE